MILIVSDPACRFCIGINIRQECEIQNIMRDLLYLIAVILVIGWLLGVFYFSAGAIIHVLLVLAVIAVLFRLIGGGKV
jgi:hypothetical protein